MKLTRAERERQKMLRQQQSTQPRPPKTVETSAPRPTVTLAPVPIVEWHGCYDEGWRGMITPESFSHPAKAGRKLLVRIFRHLAGLGVPSGAIVVDPFGGIGTTALIGAWHGYKVICCELEPKFFELATKNVEAQTPFLREMHRPIPTIVNGDSRQLRKHIAGPLDAIVSSPPYSDQGIQGGDQGNLIGKGQRSDGREISNGIEGEGSYGQSAGQLGAMETGSVEAVIGSPPYTEEVVHARPSKMTEGIFEGRTARTGLGEYGKEEGQLGAMEPGNVDAVISSPPYSEGLGHGGTPTPGGGRVLAAMQEGYGDTEGQLTQLPEGNIDAIVSSPPYEEIATGAGGLNTKPAKDGQQGGRSAESPSQDTDQRYGDTSGQLARMEKGTVEAIVSSPPYADQQMNPGETSRPEAKIARLIAEGNLEDAESVRRSMSGAASNLRQQEYGQSDGQLGAMTAGEIDAVISSPPYAETLLNDDQRQAGKGEPLRWGTHEEYGTSPGQLGVMKEDVGVDAVVSSPPFGSGDSASAQSISERTDKSAEWVKNNCGPAATQGYGSSPGQMAELSMNTGVDAVVTSPPYEATLNTVEDPERRKERTGGFECGQKVTRYGETEGQVGALVGDTFWTAARDIVRECHALLKPGGYAVWIVKAFVRDKAIVDFPGDWRKLCEYIGFETLTEVHAMLVKEHKLGINLLEVDDADRKTRKSFFRRLAEAKGSPKIDHEVIWIMRKP